MGRWEPNARGRLVEAALELYRERGFDQTTVAEIAARAGLTERTFFRYFADKREVLFSGSEQLEATLVAAIAEAPAKLGPFDAVARAVEACCAAMSAMRTHEQAHQRWEVVMAHPELRERELIKMARLGAALGAALHARGVSEPAASLAAQAGIATFVVAFERWMQDGGQGLGDHLHEAVGTLRAVVGPGKAPSRVR